MTASPYVLAAVLSLFSLAAYFAGAVWNRLAAAPTPDPIDFTLGLPRTSDVNALFATSLVAAATPASSVIAFFITATVHPLALLACPLLFCGGLYVLLWTYRASIRNGYLDGADACRMGAGLLPYLLYRSTRSRAVAVMVAAISGVTLLAVLTLELSVALDLITGLAVHTTGRSLSSPVMFLLFSVFVGLLLGYVFIGGFRAVVASDIWQMSIIQWAVGLTAVSALVYVFTSLAPATARAAPASVPASATLLFLLSATVGNLAVPLSLQTSWQRFKAFSLEPDFHAATAIRHACVKLTYVWTALVLIGLALQRLPAAGESQELLPQLRLMLDRLTATGNAWLTLFLFPVFTVAVLSAIFSTADTCVSSLVYLVEVPGSLSLDRRMRSRLERRHYVAMAVILAASLAVFAFVNNRNFLQLVFVAYSSLAVVAPSVLTLALPPDTAADGRRRAIASTASLAAGAAAYWTCAIAALVVGSFTLSLMSVVVGLVAAAAPLASVLVAPQPLPEFEVPHV